MLHIPGSYQCPGCKPIPHKNCKKKGLIHTIFEPSYEEGIPPTKWQRCDACGVKPRIKLELETLTEEELDSIQ